MQFDLKEAIRVANEVMLTKVSRHLTSVEILVLEGAWERREYDEIAARNQYATSYISQDVAPKLWKTLSDALGERVKKSNFKEALKRYWQQTAIATIATPFAQTTVLQAEGGRSPSTAESPSSEQYVERPPIESICLETLQQPGSLLRIKAPALMGKTLLVNRMLSQIIHHGYRTVCLSLELADRHIHFTHLDKFLRWFCINLSRELGMANQLEEYWDEEGIGSKVSCTTYVEDYILAVSSNPLVLCLDDVDLLFPYPEVYEDFFGLLRSWYEKARSRPIWKRLRLVIVHSTDVYIRLNINQSPFNVGVPIELSEFTVDQVREFAYQHNLTAPDLVEPLMQMVGGHPYLLEKALTFLKSHPDITLTQLLTDAPTEAGIYGSHLREHWQNLQQHSSLAAALKRIVEQTSPVQLEPIAAYQLHSMGLIRLTGNEAEPRCSLYRQYFQRYLGEVG
jgi:hypothetical protein